MNSIFPIKEIEFFIKGIFRRRKLHIRSLVHSVVSNLCNPMDCSLPGFSVHGILQARILEWVAIPFSRESSLLRDWTWVSWFAGRFFTVWTPRGAYLYVWKYWSRNKKRHTIFMNSKFNMVKKSILHNSFLITKSSHSIYNPIFYQNL